MASSSGQHTGDEKCESVGCGNSVLQYDFLSPPGEHDKELSMLADLCILLDDGDKLYAAKAIVGLHSRLLNQMFTAMPNLKEIHIRQLKSEDMITILLLMYPPAVASTNSFDDYDGMLQTCNNPCGGSDYLYFNLINENTIHCIMSFAEEYDCPAIKARCEQYLIKHVTSMGTRMAATAITATAHIASDAASDDGHEAPTLSISNILQLAEDYNAHSRVKHVCEAVLIYRQSSTPCIDNAILAEKFELEFLTVISTRECCVENQILIFFT